MSVTPDPIAPGQESVWSFPRPAIAEPCARHLRIVHRGQVVAETRRAVRTLETSHPPSYYFPRNDIAAWAYSNPTDPFDILKDHVAFYVAPFDQCTVDGEEVRPQPGDFYGGWVTSHVAGPFKGIPGSWFW